MATIIIPGYKGGLTDNLFDPIQKQTYITSKDLDVFADTNLLRPHPLRLQSITNPTATGGSDYVFNNSYAASNGKIYFVGYATISSVQNIVLWYTSEIVASPTYTTAYNTGAASPGSVLEEYKDGLFFSHGTNLDRWGNLSGTPSRSNISSSLDSVATALRYHPGIGKLYFAHGKKIGSYDNSSVTLSALTIDNSEECVGLEPYGKYMIVGLRGSGSARSRLLVWDGESTEVEDVIELGDVGLQGFKVVNGEIRYITITNQTLGGNALVRLYTVVPGGRPQLISERQLTISSGSATIGAMGSIGDLFLYGFSGSAYSIELGLFAYGSGSASQPKANALWRLVSTGVTTGVSIRSINAYGSNLIVIWSTQSGGGTYKIDVLTGTDLTATTSDDGVYQSPAFLLNNGRQGKITRIKILHKALPDACGFTVKVRHWGNYPIDGSVEQTDGWVTLTTPQGSGTSVGKTQSTRYTTYTLIQDLDLFKKAYFAQIEIDFDEVSGSNAPEVLWPIIIETDPAEETA